MDGDRDRPSLDPVERRVVGALLEKEVTVPASYPMTLNGLRTACNQTSGRDPILHLDDAQVQGALDRLKAAGLARFVHAGSGARALKFRQVLDEKVGLERGERAVLTVLLLRGAQTPGELRSRTDRLHAFADLGQVEAALHALAGRPEPFVRELERRPGQKERRWVHLLAPEGEVDADPAAGPAAGEASGSGSGSGGAGSAGGVTAGSAGRTGSDPSATEAVLAAGPERRDARVTAAYDRLATAYADELVDELDRKPFDRWLLERLAGEARGPVADVGTGPGHVAFHLAAAGADVTGFDLSPEMVAEARRRFPELAFEVADLRHHPAPEAGAGWALVTAWYALVHLAGSEVRGAVASLAGTLAPGGRLAMAVHVGSEVRHVDELFGLPVDVDFALHDPGIVLAAFAAAGLTEVEWYQRGPYAGAESPTERLYVVGRRPA